METDTMAKTATLEERLACYEDWLSRIVAADMPVSYTHLTLPTSDLV